jgi:small subunit ribosomal protein S16
LRRHYELVAHFKPIKSLIKIMATKIRLQRHGRKGYAFYSIVIADVRAPRDGKFTEKIGTYNPNTNPATVDLKFDRALYWVECGAQPTDTVRNILSGEGVYLMKHLRGGVKKGAFDEAACQAKFDAWKADKQKGLSQVAAKNEADKKAAAAERLKAEKKVGEEIAKKVADKKSAEAVAQAEAEAETKVEEAAEEAAPAPEAEVQAEPEAAPAAEEATTETPAEA